MLAADATSGGFIGLWAVIYFVLMVTLGIMSIRKGHWVMFIIGIFLATLLADRRSVAQKGALTIVSVAPPSRRTGAPTTTMALARYGAPSGGLPLELAYPRAARRRVPEISWVESSRLTRSSNETHVR